MNNRLNMYKYPGAKRLMLEAQELKDKTEDYCAQPLDDNLFEWHFTVRGPPDTAFDGGYYHGRLSFPTEYPMKPPSIILLTPNGRFEINKKICLSISGYHPETWQPSWSVRTALLALIAFMPTKAHRAIGALDYSDAERQQLAIKSQSWRCETCGLIRDLLKHPEKEGDKQIELDSGNQCEPGTSRLNNCSPEVIRNYSEGSNSDKSDNEKENRDDSLSPTSTTSFSEHSDASSSKYLNDNPISNTKLDQSEQLNCTPKNAENSVSDPSIQSTENVTPPQQSVPSEGIGTENFDGRRTSVSVVLRSIFALLFLLILRRVVMVIAS